MIQLPMLLLMLNAPRATLQSLHWLKPCTQSYYTYQDAAED